MHQGGKWGRFSSLDVMLSRCNNHIVWQKQSHFPTSCIQSFLQQAVSFWNAEYEPSFERKIALNQVERIQYASKIGSLWLKI